MSKNLTRERICIEKIIHEHQDEYDKIHNSNLGGHHLKKLRAAFFKKKLWPKNSKILIGFLGNPPSNLIKTPLQNLKQHANEKKIDPLQEEVYNTDIKVMIKKIIKERIQPLVNLHISFVDDPNKANVRISFDPAGGSWSLVGTDHLKTKKDATINFGWFDVPTVIHEFGHMLGMIHEHQNPRGETIKWDKNKLYSWTLNTQGWGKEKTNINIIDKYDIENINGSNYDPLSIMLYFFPANLTTNNKGSYQNLKLSGLDVKWINKMYPTKIDISQFYKKIYNEKINTSISKSKKQAKSGKNKLLNIMIIVGIIILLLMGIGIYFVFYKYRKNNRR